MRPVEDLLRSTGPDRGSVSVGTATLKTGEQQREGAHLAVLQALPTLPESSQSSTVTSRQR